MEIVLFKILASPSGAATYVVCFERAPQGAVLCSAVSLPLIKSATKAPHADWGPTVPKASPPLSLRDLKTLWRQCRERGEWAGQIYAHKNCPNYHKLLLGTAKSSPLSLSHSHKPLDLEWRQEECLSVGEKKLVWNLVSLSQRRVVQ